MSGSAGRSVIRSFRISLETDKELRKEAALRGISLNALVSQIFKKFIEWDRYTERYGFVTITRDGFQAIHEAVDEDTLMGVAKDIGERNPGEATSFWFKKVDLNTLLSWLTLHCKYGRIAECEIQRKDAEYTIALYHAMDEKYSRFLANMYAQAPRKFGQVEPRFVTTKNSVTFTFETPT
jgi:hypothetical protein